MIRSLLDIVRPAKAEIEHVDVGAVARVFQPFFTTKPPGQGTGLGLTICGDIVKEHEGTIRIEDAPDGGATVSVWLPVADAAA